jgi:glycosyltransferase involved in cell wall biosynthesis
MAKQTLIFDASVIAENLGNGRGRSGIYFATYNILRGLIDSGEFDVSLYSGADNFDFVDFVKREFGDDIKIYFTNKYALFLSKMIRLDKELRAKKRNISKLLLNIFVRKPIIFFGRNVKMPQFDVAFSPIRVFPDIIKANKKYIILYDAIPLLLPNYYPSVGLKKHWFYNLTEYIKTKPACKYFAISQSCKNDFVRLLDMNPDDITVIPLAANGNFYHEPDAKKIQAAREKYNIPADKKYVFSLCTLEPRKNLIRAVKTFIEFIKKNKIDDMVFVLGGAHWNEFIGKLESEIDDLGKYKDKIIRAGYIDDADLAALYSGAEWFVYTSQYEGFGLPPLEAMQCGCPIITSNNSSLPEVVGDAGVMIDWDNDEQHISAYENYYNNQEFREEMRKKGLARAKKFTWQNTADIITKQIKGDK